MNDISLFDFMDQADKEKFAPKKSTDWKWKFSDYPEKNGIKVFSCFACGGGSTMGYKLAGCEVLGDLEIDKRMNDVYVANHHPKYNFLMDIREFNKKEDLPEELYKLDILDGSPPCTTFSMSGEREESWGKKKKFREGQSEQTLDDLSFVFIETVRKLKPKTVIMENVEGLLFGEAWSYVQRIYKDFDNAGYNLKHWLLKGENMGIPQTRHRVFFIAIRKDIEFNYENIDMTFNYEPITFGQVKDTKHIDVSENTRRLLSIANRTDKRLGDILLRTENRNSMFNCCVVWDEMISQTIHNHGFYRADDVSKFTRLDYIHCQTFPEDYDELNQSISYICGMSVPPVMIKRIVTRLIEKGLYGKR